MRVEGKIDVQNNCRRQIPLGYESRATEPAIFIDAIAQFRVHGEVVVL